MLPKYLQSREVSLVKGSWRKEKAQLKCINLVPFYFEVHVMTLILNTGPLSWHVRYCK